MRQTLFLSVADAKTLVHRVGLDTIYRGLVERLEEDYRRWDSFTKSARLAYHSPVGVVELMPIADDRLMAYKYVNGHPYNYKHDLPTVMAYGALAEVETGMPLLLAEMTILTAIRTAAASAMAAKAVARPHSRTMAMIGNGAQAEFQILAFRAILGVNTVRLFDIDPEATAKLQRNLAHIEHLDLVRCGSTAEAVKGCDIVTTCTADKKRSAVLTPDMIEPGMHINGIGGDAPGKTELHPDVVSASKVFVQYEPQTRIEGDIQQLPAEFPVTEIARVLTGEATGRESAEQVTLFDSVGFSIEDYSMLRYMHELLTETGLGAPLDLIPPLADVKDVYGLIR